MGFLPWPPALLLLLLLHLSAASQTPDQHSCLNTSGVNYTSNSIFDSNLNSVLSTMSHNVGDNGFYNASAGQSPDRANAVALCRGDVQLDVCRSCVKEAAAELVRLCPNQKQGVIYYEFCLLRFSNISIFGSFVPSPVSFTVSPQNATEPYLFFRDLGILLDALSNRAAGGSSRRKVAFGNRSTYNSQTLYALVQCSPDLRRDDCLSCLREIDRNQGSRYGSRIGCRALLPSCNIRFETQPFYNETRLQELSESTPEILTPPITGQGKESRTIIVVVVVIATCLAIAACVGILIARRTKKKQVEAIENDIRLVDSLQFEFDEIKAATNDFSDANKLGKGGFGAVYRGKLVSGQEIAVKRLSADSGQGHIEFKNEVSLVAKLQHRNLVKLMGFSIERKERLLVYELVTNASLDKFLFDPTKSSELGWERRNKIIFGIARGLHYLHEESRLRIIHRDLKASNVLLDNDMNPKIADFGLAWLCVADELQGDTNRVAGTYGYMAPEYVMHGQFSVKSDVFSFGVLVLETISGQKNNSFRGDEYVEGLLSLAWKLWRGGKAEELIDPLLRVDASNHIYALRCIHIGLLCVQENPCDRPNMAAVVLMLGSDSISLSNPREPAFFMPGGGGDDSNNALVRVYGFKEVKSNESYCGKKLGRSVEASENKLTVTDLYPR